MATLYGSIAVILWGMLALLGSLTTRLAPFQLLFLCFIVAALIMFLWRLMTGRKLLDMPELSPLQWLMGLYGLFGFHFCYFMALRNAPAIEVSLIVYLWPLLLAVMVASQGNRARAAIGGVVGFLGISILLLGYGTISIDGEHFTGYLFSAACALIWSSYSWFLARTPSKVEDIGWISLAVAVCSLIAHLSMEASNWSFTSGEWLGVLLLGLGPVGGAFYLWDYGLKRGNQSFLASWSYNAPLISAVVLALAGLNNWSAGIVTALIMVSIGALIANWKTREDKKKANLQQVGHSGQE